MKETFFARFFYGFARAYELGDSIVHFPDIALKRFMKVRVPPDSRLILELGCGTGRSTRMFKGGNATLINVDINKAFVAYGKQKGRLANPVVGSAYGLCFAGSVFDTIIIPDAFHHMLKHELLFQECFRTLKEGGQLIIFDIILAKKAPNKIINHPADGPIWILDREGFIEKIKALADSNAFTLRDVSTTKEKTIMGLIGGIDVLATLTKRGSGPAKASG